MRTDDLSTDDRVALEDVIAALQAYRQPTDGPVSLPPACYVSDAVAEAEIDRIFRQSWFCIGRADRFAASGDYAALDVAGQSIIVVRDRGGILRAFANTCRHRGARLIDGEGRCNGIRCPFHSWTYKLDGSLRAAPRMDNVPGFEKSANGLIAYRIAERYGFAFICLNPSAPSIDDHLGEFGAIHAPWPLEDLVTVRRRGFSVNCNWKGFLEVFNEYYHLPTVHPTTVNNLYLDPEPAEVGSGAFASQFGGTEGTGGLLEGMQEMALPTMPGLSEPWSSGVRYSWIFPNMTFAAGTDALWIYEAFPDGPNRCRIFQSICFPKETMTLEDFETRANAYIERLDAAIEEDIPALENQQHGLSCPDARPGPFQTALEPNLASFARWYAAQFTT